ncbi:hypothetical protein [Aquimarina sp. MMG016]|nr:hypothetical protein [Aquimarina sp. MMG016]
MRTLKNIKNRLRNTLHKQNSLLDRTVNLYDRKDILYVERKRYAY